eukprot:5868804-Prymnesium_polylepis.1
MLRRVVVLERLAFRHAGSLSSPATAICRPAAEQAPRGGRRRDHHSTVVEVDQKRLPTVDQRRAEAIGKLVAEGVLLARHPWA